MPIIENSRLKFFVGLNTGYVTDGKPDNRLIDFYKSRSSPELYCAIVGNVVIPGGHGTTTNTPKISRVTEWTQLSVEIENSGSIPGIQLTTTWEGFAGPKSFRSPNSHEVIKRSRELVHNLGHTGIVSVLSAFNEGTDLAVSAGFRHIQIHAAHGYLFSLLVDDRFNDEAPMVRDRLADWARKYAIAGIETSIRISLRTGDVDFDAVGRNQFYENIACMPIDFIDVSSGFYSIDKRLIYPGRPDVLRERRNETVALAKLFPRKRFIFSGRAMLEPEHDLAPNIHIGLCRDLIANPNYLRDTKTACVNSGKCHYFSRGEDHLSCSQWPAQPSSQ